MTKARATASNLDAVERAWLKAWPDALAAWSKFTRLHAPKLCRTREEAEKEGLRGSFAMIRLSDQSVVVGLPEVIENGVSHLPVEVLAHEVGHHVLAPSNLTDHGRMIARMRRALPTLERHAPFVANLYTDLLINDRLQRSAGLRMSEVYRALGVTESPNKVWQVYLRIYEVLWSLPRGTLVPGQLEDRQEGDAWLGARLLRSYARDFLDGSGGFASLLLPYLAEDEHALDEEQRWHDTRDAASGSNPSGLADGENEPPPVHPALDPRVNDEPEAPTESNAAEPREAPVTSAAGQTRQPFEYGEILRAMGLKLDDHEVAIRYYRERALPHLVPFPSRPLPISSEPLPEGLEPWDYGSPLDSIDWLQSVLTSPHVVPGLTTVQRSWGTMQGQLPKSEPLDLDLYVDSSGSMANPQRQLSYPALAGAIICLSALRAGARVQATLWSGAQQFHTTAGFVRDEQRLLGVLTGYFGGATAFPIHVLRDTFEHRAASARPAHLLVISDDGVSTAFDRDERGNSGWDVMRRVLLSARGGATFVLNLRADWESVKTGHAFFDDAFAAIRKARDELGVDVVRVASWEDLVAFARAFARKRYAEQARG
ncbi:MAG: hypothetical protein ABUL62_15105 [Myxococcales bacterium]